MCGKAFLEIEKIGFEIPISHSFSGMEENWKEREAPPLLNDRWHQGAGRNSFPSNQAIFLNKTCYPKGF